MTKARRTHRDRGTPLGPSGLVILLSLTLVAAVPWALDAQVSGEPSASSQAASDDVDLLRRDAALDENSGDAL